MDYKELKDVLKGLDNNSESFNSLILNSIFDGVYIVDEEHKILFWNKGAENITGYKSSEVIGRKCSDDILNHFDNKGNLLCDTEHCLIQRTFSTGNHVQDNVYTLHKSGKRFLAQAYMSPIKDSNGNVIAGIEVFRDISAEEEVKILQKKINKQISKYLPEEAYNRIIDGVSNGVVHYASEEILTIAFIDIVSFTNFAENNKPPVVIDMLNQFFSSAEKVIYKNNGYVDKFIGDSILAVFIDANDAVKASQIILNETLKEVNKNASHKIKLRIGIDSGVVIKGDVGSKYRKDLTVIGDTVNTADRIQHRCPQNSMLITGATYLLLNNQQDYKFYKNIKLRGKSKEVPVYII